LEVKALLVHEKNNPLTNKLALDVPFLEGGGTTLRDLVSKANGTVSGSPAFGIGPAGRYARFIDGANLVSFATRSPINSATQISIELLVSANDHVVAGTGDPRILRKGSTVTGEVWTVQQTNTNSRSISFAYGFTTSAGLWIAPVASTYDTLVTHVVITYDNRNVANVPSIYINGQKVAVTTTAPVGTPLPDDANFYIGNRQALDRGAMSDVYYARIWNRILTAREVGDLASNPWQIYRNFKNIPTLSPHIGKRTLRMLTLLGVGI
jgi:hypothetical protein